MTERNPNPHHPCVEYEPDLVLYYYRELGENESQRVVRHLEACMPCRRYVDELELLLPLTVNDDRPPQGFWDDYSRELRSKIDEVEAKKSWWEQFLALFRSWPVPTAATAMVVLLALTLTVGRNSKNGDQTQPGDESNVEIVLMVNEAEFFKNLELLDSLDVLENQGASLNGSESL